MSMVFDHMSFYYNKGQKDEVQALDSITMTIENQFSLLFLRAFFVIFELCNGA